MIQLTASLLLTLASTGDHAALHPLDANLFLDLPDVPGALSAYRQAPLVRLVTDEEIGDLVRNLAGLPEDFELAPAILGQAEGLVGADGVGLAQALLAFGAEVRSASLSIVGLTPEEGAAPSAAELAADPTALLDALGLQLVLEFDGTGPPERLLDLALETLGSRTPGAGPAAIEVLGKEREVQHLGGAPGEGTPSMWAVKADRLLILGVGTADPRALAARAAGGPSLLTRGDVPGAERFTTPAGVTVYRTQWWLPKRPFLADLLEGGQLPGVVSGVAQALLGNWIPLDPQLAQTRLQLREGRFVKEGFAIPLAPPDEAWRQSIGHAPLAQGILGRVSPQSVWVWATSISRAGLRDLAQRLVEVVLEEQPLGTGAPPPELAAELGPLLDRILGTVGEDVAVYLLPIGGLKVPQIHAVLELEDAEAFERGITDFARLVESQAGGRVSVDTRPYRRQPVVTIKPDLSGLEVPGFLTSLFSVDLTIGIVGERAIVGLSAMDVKREMRGLLAAEGGAHPMALEGAVPAGVSAASYMDWGALVGGLYDTARTLLALAPDMGMLPVNTSELPESKLFTRFFRPSRSWSVTDDAGTYSYSESSFGPEVALAGLVLGGGTFLGTSRTVEWDPGEGYVLEVPPADGAESPAAHHDRTRQALQEVKLGLVLYRSDRGELPERLAALLEPSETFPSGYLRGSALPEDGWGRALRYERTGVGQGFELWSLGPNGEDERGAGDDVVAP